MWTFVDFIASVSFDFQLSAFKSGTKQVLLLYVPQLMYFTKSDDQYNQQPSPGSIPTTVRYRCKQNANLVGAGRFIVIYIMYIRAPTVLSTSFRYRFFYWYCT